MIEYNLSLVRLGFITATLMLIVVSNPVFACDYDDCMTVVGDNDWLGVGNGGSGAGLGFGGSGAAGGSVGTGNGGGSGAGQGNENSPPGKDDPEKDRSACLASASNFNKICLTNVGLDGLLLKNYCDNIPLKLASTRCKAIITVGTLVATGACNIVHDYTKDQCNQLPDL